MLNKLLLTLTFLTLLCGQGWATDYTSNANCVFAWLMEVDQNPLQDDSGHSVTGALQSANHPDYLTSSPPGSFSTAYYDWDGVQDYVLGAAGASLSGTGAFTIVMWVKPDSLISIYNIISQRGPGYDGEYVVRVDENGIVSFFLYNGDYEFNISSTGNIDNGQWHHLAFVRNGDGTGTIYIDGSVDGNGAGTGSGSSKSLVNTNRVYVGYDAIDAAKYFPGSFDEIALFNKALNSTEINEIKNSGLKPSSGTITRRVMVIDE